MMASSSRLPKLQSSRNHSKKEPALKSEKPIKNLKSKVQDVRKTAEDLLQRKVEADLNCKAVEENVKINQHKYLCLLQQKEEAEFCLKENIQKAAIFKTRASLSREQAVVCIALKEKAESINQKLACRLTDEVNSPEQSFVFNPAAKKLQSAIKSSIEKCLKYEEISHKSTVDVLKNYSCTERLDSVTELQNELNNELIGLINAENQNHNAVKIGEELQELDNGEMALQPMESHLKEFAMQHTRCFLEEQDLVRENIRLEKQFTELLRNNPEITKGLKKNLDYEQIQNLEVVLQDLSLQNHNSGSIELESEKILSRIESLNKELKDLKHSIMKGVSTMEKLARQQQQFLTEVMSSEKSSKELDKLLDIENLLLALMKKLYQMPLSGASDQLQSESLSTILDTDLKGRLGQIDILQLRQEESNKLQGEKFRTFKAGAGKAKHVIAEKVSQLQQTVCVAQNLYLQHSNAAKQFEEKLQAWKERAVEKQLVEDLERTANNLNLQEWVEIFKESFPDINDLSSN